MEHAALDGVHLTGGVADHQRGTLVGLGLTDGGQSLVGVGAHGDLSHIDIAVAHGDLSQALLGSGLTGSGELGHSAEVGGLGSLTAGVGVDLGIEDHDVHVLAGSQNVVQTAEADVVSPAVAAEDPDGLLGQELLALQDLAGQLAGIAGAAVHNTIFQSGNVSLGSLAVGHAIIQSVQPGLSGSLQLGNGVLHSDELLGLLDQAVTDGLLTEVEAQAVLGVVFKQAVGPGGTTAVLGHGVGRGGGGVAPDGGTAGGVGDIHPLAADLGDETGIAGRRRSRRTPAEAS